MSHPFTSQRRALIIYIIAWLTLAVVNVLVLRFYRDLPLSNAIAEAIVSVFLFGLLGMIIWYPTRYIPFRKETPIYSFLAHAIAGFLIIFVWLFSSVGILNALFNEDEAYREFLTESLIWRGVLGALVYLVLVLIYYLVSYARTLRERAKAEEKLKTLVKESELNLLKSQINPHFLFNSLNSISSLISSNPEEAREMIIRLSDFLRYSLKHREHELVSLEEEIIRMKDYLSIEQIRFGDKLKYDLSINSECGKIKVPTMILQPLVENAIRHGVYESLDPVNIRFKCLIKGDMLILTLENDYDPDIPPSRGTGVGLQNVSERIRLAYDGRGMIEYKANQGIFTVKLNIPID